MQTLRNEAFDDLFQLSRAETMEQRLADIEYNLLSARVVLTLHNEVNNEIACFATLSNYGVYENLYVFSKYRRRGYARKMDSMIVDTAAKHGFTKVYTTVRSDNGNIGKRLESWNTHKIHKIRAGLELITYRKDIFDIRNIFRIIKRFVYR